MPFQLHSAYVQDLSIESPNAPSAFFDSEPSEIAVSLSSSAARLNEQFFKCALRCEVISKTGERVNFLVDATQEALFFLENASDEEISRLAEIDGPTLILPYLRSTVFSAVQMSGFPPVHLAHVDFSKVEKSQTTV